jgi:hypothetical protein
MKAQISAGIFVGFFAAASALAVDNDIDFSNIPSDSTYRTFMMSIAHELPAPFKPTDQFYLGTSYSELKQ